MQSLSLDSSRSEWKEGKDFARAAACVEAGDGNEADVQAAQARGCRGLHKPGTRRDTVKRRRCFGDITKGQHPYMRVLAEESVAVVNKELLDASNRDRPPPHVNFGIHLLHLYPGSGIL